MNNDVIKYYDGEEFLTLEELVFKHERKVRGLEHEINLLKGELKMKKAIMVNIECVEEKTQKEYEKIINNFCKELKKLQPELQKEVLEALKNFDTEKEY